ncbi:MAG: hypothetical protein H8E39_08945 [Alphaproteobacteria bacterium]|nr:hypothetical protein [Alphaproteobacteria bacterium]
MVESLRSPSSFDIANARRVLGSASVDTSGIERQYEVIRTGQQTAIEVANQRTGKARETSLELTKIISFLSNVVDRIKTLRRLSDGLTAEVAKADRFGSGDNAAQFDITLAQLDSVAKQASDAPNLLNSSPDDDFAFLTTEDGRVVTLSGAALGTGYTITEENGNFIFSDHEAAVLRQVDPLKEPFSAPLSANYVLYSKNVRLDEIDTFDPDKVTITIYPDTNAAQTYTGTVSREGLGILDSYLYDGFATAAGRSRAFEDLRAARNTIDAELARFEGALKSVRLISGERDLSLASFVSVFDSSTSASVIELHAADSARAFQNDFRDRHVNGIETARNELAKVLGGVDLNLTTNTIIDIIA